INAQVERPSPDSVAIKYLIETGRRYRVNDISIIGTQEFGFGEVADELKTRRATFLSRGITSQELLRRDSETIKNKLQDLGYIKADVVERRLGVTPNNENL